MDPGLCYAEELTKCTDPFIETKIVVLVAPAPAPALSSMGRQAAGTAQAPTWPAVQLIVQPRCLMHLE